MKLSLCEFDSESNGSWVYGLCSLCFYYTKLARCMFRTEINVILAYGLSISYFQSNKISLHILVLRTENNAVLAFN